MARHWMKGIIKMKKWFKFEHRFEVSGGITMVKNTGSLLKSCDSLSLWISCQQTLQPYRYSRMAER